MSNASARIFRPATLPPPPTANFMWLLAELNESSDSYRILSIEELNPAEEFLSEMERLHSLPKTWYQKPRAERLASIASYLAEVDRLKRKSGRGHTLKGGSHD
ncbi:hypothetical protein [Salmonirosea aquatica]|uniref:Uncharacterized protein n=1 Tax=Salmonirosea aquatica TaxID=2654236 RepID=A0A7C9BFT0_9BACT|nr:hypothetical protein [Cytophagaceae bacterium SJW1-29]